MSIDVLRVPPIQCKPHRMGPLRPNHIEPLETLRNMLFSANLSYLVTEPLGPWKCKLGRIGIAGFCPKSMV